MPNDEAVPTAAGQAAVPQEPAAAWRKARRSGAENGGCVEVLGGVPGLAGIRDPAARTMARTSCPRPPSPRSWRMPRPATTT